MFWSSRDAIQENFARSRATGTLPGGEVLQFVVERVPGNGDCGFTVIGIPRDEAADKLFEHLNDDPSFNVDRAGPRVAMVTVEERQRTLLSFFGYLVNVKGADEKCVNLEHTLDQELVLAFDAWTDCIRGTKFSTWSKRMSHLALMSSYTPLVFPGLAQGYGGVPDAYRRLVGQLQHEADQEVKQD